MIIYSPLNYLIEEITNREIPQADSIIELLHPSRDRARSIFISQLNIALKEFCKHYPLTMTKEVPSSPYTFIDNSPGYILGNIDFKNLELIPQSIANVKMTLLGKSTTRNTFIYDIKSHTINNATGLVTYFANYPVHYELDENNGFTDESGIYLLDPTSSEGNMFIDQLAYCLLASINNSRNTIAPQFNMQFFDFTNRLRELLETITTNNAYSSTIYNIWSNTGI